jgi:hypothetical protein
MVSKLLFRCLTPSVLVCDPVLGDLISDGNEHLYVLRRLSEALFIVFLMTSRAPARCFLRSCESH